VAPVDKERTLLEVLRALERDGKRLSVGDLVAHVERATGFQDTRHYLTRMIAGTLVHGRAWDDTVVVTGAVALSDDDFANPARKLPESLWRLTFHSGSVAPPPDSDQRAKIAQRIAEDAARCEAAGVHVNPPFLPPTLRPPSHQIGWQHPFVVTVSLESWDAGRPGPGVDKAATTSTWNERVAAVQNRAAHGTTGPRATWSETYTWDYSVCRAAGDRWTRVKVLGTFAALDEALACAVAWRAHAD
jgi:hypothetical protein